MLIAVAIPLLVAGYGWRMLGGFATGSGLPAAVPQAAGAAATSAATARAAQPTSKPTVGAPPTVRAKAPTPGPAPATATSVPSDALAPEPTPLPAPDAEAAPPAAGPTAEGAVALAEPSDTDPGTAVSSFYTLVSNHEFDSAAELWSPRMRAAFPPQVNLNQRFGQTQDIRLQRANVVTQNQVQATVQVDLVESDGSSGQRHYVGTWYLVRGPNGWLLDQPQLQSAP
ncbi:MAG: hypothetical protein M3069_18825 [Chloroflexota bacterium]|nr:hypothetical protein [Chloroflexota bacterium]